MNNFIPLLICCLAFLSSCKQAKEQKRMGMMSPDNQFQANVNKVLVGENSALSVKIYNENNELLFHHNKLLLIKDIAWQAQWIVEKDIQYFSITNGDKKYKYTVDLEERKLVLIE